MSKHTVPIVNVFDEDQSAASMQPARRPVVVEIEDIPTQMQQPMPPTMSAPAEPTVTNAFPADASPARAVWQPQPEITMSAPTAPMAPVPPAMPEIPMQAPAPVAPVMQPTMETNVMPVQGMTAEPMLPSFFEHDLKGASAPVMPQSPMQAAPVMPSVQPVPNMFADASATIPQAIVGEIDEAAGSGSNKKIIGIVLMVLAVLILAIGGLFLYARNLFGPTSVPTPTPEVVATPRPTPAVTPTPAATASATPSASESAALKKKIKVDVLNGTKTPGLAAKQAALIKAAGFVTGTVGNGKADEAGTIVLAPEYKGLATEIKATLKDFTFTVSEDAKATSIKVTLGE